MGTQSAILLDALFCEESVDETEDYFETTSSSIPPMFLLEQDMFWEEDEELLSLFSKEKQTNLFCSDIIENDQSLSVARTESVLWILRVNSYYGFSALTAILAVNYLDRFLCDLRFQKDKPWMIQLAAVTCLSLAAKFEEIHVPLLLDFQVEDAKYVFEAKTIQRMELLVLSRLKWRMKTVTPLSFLHYIISRLLGFNNHLHWDFFTRCESLLLFLLPDSRLVRYMPSVLATSTMLHVIRQLDPSNADDYQNQLLHVLKINQEKVKDCYELIQVLSNKTNHHKRKDININEDVHHHHIVPISSPSCVIDPNFSCEESSDESWGMETQPLVKKTRIEELVI